VKAIAAFLDPAHEGLSDSVSSWASAKLRPRAEAITDDEARTEARALLKEIGSAGWLAAIESEDLRAVCLVREAVAAESPLADAVVAIQGLAATALVLGGSEAQRQQWLPEMVSGRAMAAFAMTEPAAGSDVAAMRTIARQEGDAWVIDGEKHLISNAGIADVYLVFAKTSPEQGSRGISAFLVKAGTAGLEFGGAQVMAAPHPLGRLSFRGCRVPSTSVVGEIDRGFKLGMMTLDRLRPTVGAAACGMAARALAEAIAHARARRQFGQRLADMPLVRAKIGQMATELDAARLLVYRAAWEQARGATRISVPAAMAKSFATEMAQRVVDEAVQIVGGSGVVVGHVVERLYRSVRALRIYEGATDIQRLIVAGGLLDEAGHA
jgi:alkylation response protein AidB-like acyl-CoA dehydrogenase